MALMFLVAARPAPAKRINLDVQDADVHNVLRLLADTGAINIVVPDHVKGRVTLKLRNVPWTEALDVVLRSKGLGQERSGNVVHIDTLENIQRRLEAKAAIREAKKGTAELMTVMIPLRYAKAADLQPIVQSMLSERGRVVIDKRTNMLIVTDVVHNVDRVRRTLGI